MNEFNTDFAPVGLGTQQFDDFDRFIGRMSQDVYDERKKQRAALLAQLTPKKIKAPVEEGFRDFTKPAKPRTPGYVDYVKEKK